jgi:hypothetical protein
MPRKPSRQIKSAASVPETTAGMAAARSPESQGKEALNKLLLEAKAILQAFPGGPAFPDPRLELHLSNLNSIAHELTTGTTLTSALQETRNTIESALANLPFTLKEFSDSNNLKLFGAFPDHIIDGTLYISFDLARYRAVINDAPFPLFPIQNVLAQISKELTAQRKQAFQPEKFLSDLWTAYRNTLSKQGHVPNSEHSRQRVSIHSLLVELAITQQDKAFFHNPIQKNFKSYSEHAFRADLYRLLVSAEAPVFEKRRLKLEPQAVAERGIFMYLPSMSRCAFVGHLLFE